MTAAACHALLEATVKAQDRDDLPCPLQARPSCHTRNGKFLVHVDGRRRIIYLSCSVCDRLVSKVKLHKKMLKNMELEE